jgi:hypothetical protein
LRFFPELLQDIRFVENTPGFQRAAAQNLYRGNVPSGDHEQFRLITVFVNSDMPDGHAFADEVAKTVLEGGQTSQPYSRLTITIIHGYDLGFASG